MRPHLIVLSLLLAPAIASAKPLPDGIKVAVVKGHLMVTKDGVTIPLIGEKYETTKLIEVGLSDDGKSISVKQELCSGMIDDGSDATLIALTELQARIENYVGMRFHEKKQYADAIKHFTLAAQASPDTPVYATNLLSAQSMGGKLEDADQTIATYAKRNLPWWAWRLAVDSDLKALKGRPSTKLGAKTGAAKGGLGGLVAYSPLGIAAISVPINIYDGMPDGSSDSAIDFVDLKTGNLLLQLPSDSTCGVDMEKAMQGDQNPPPADKSCPKREAAKNAAKEKVSDAVLAALGFELVPNSYTETFANNDLKEVDAKDGRKVLIGDKLQVVTGGHAKDIELPMQLRAVAFVPGALLVLTKGGKVIASCDQADGPFSLDVTAISTP